MSSIPTYRFRMLESHIADTVSVPFDQIRTQLRPILDEFGFAIVCDVLTPTECAHLETLWGTDLKSIVKSSGRFNGDVRTWPLGECPLGRPLQWGLAHGQFAWNCRAHPKVKEVYQQLYQGEPVCVSLDTVFFENRPVDDPHMVSNRQSGHTDLNIHLLSAEEQRPGGFDMFQSILYVWPSGDGNSTTALWPRSHKPEVYDTYMSTFGPSDGHYCPIQPGKKHSYEFLTKYVEGVRRVSVPAGAMLVWDSRTMHQGWEGGPRLAQAICMEPTRRRSREALQKKQKLVANGVCATHWASTGRTHARTQKLGDMPERTEGAVGPYVLHHVGHLASQGNPSYMEML
eukprot:PhF_6_TR31780/c0_g1_i1/m.46799